MRFLLFIIALALLALQNVHAESSCENSDLLGSDCSNNLKNLGEIPEKVVTKFCNNEKTLDNKSKVCKCLKRMWVETKTETKAPKKIGTVTRAKPTSGALAPKPKAELSESDGEAFIGACQKAPDDFPSCILNTRFSFVGSDKDHIEGCSRGDPSAGMYAQCVIGVAKKVRNVEMALEPAKIIDGCISDSARFAICIETNGADANSLLAALGTCNPKGSPAQTPPANRVAH